MKRSDDLDWFQLEELYEEGRKLFLQGKHEEAIDRFKRIYEDTVELRDVEEVVSDYYLMPPAEWIAKYQTRFHQKDK